MAITQAYLKAGDDQAIRIRTGFDLTGILGATWKLGDEAGTVLVTKTLASGIEVEDPATDGNLQVQLASADTADLAAGTYFHEMEIVDSGGALRTVSYHNGTTYQGRLYFEAAGL